MPPWVQEGGLEAWIKRLKDPDIRARVISEMRNAHPENWENIYGLAGAEGTTLLKFKTPGLRELAGKTLADVAKIRGVSPEDVAVDLVIEDGSRVEVAYAMMSEKNTERAIGLPWVSFGSDAPGQSLDEVFLKTQVHPRAYGNVARLFAHYIREKRIISVQEAIRKLTSLPANNLSLKERGRYASVGLGLDTVDDPVMRYAGRAWTKHDSVGFFNAFMEILPDQGLGVVVLSNSDKANFRTERIVFTQRLWNSTPHFLMVQ